MWHWILTTALISLSNSPQSLTCRHFRSILGKRPEVTSWSPSFTTNHRILDGILFPTSILTTLRGRAIQTTQRIHQTPPDRVCPDQPDHQVRTILGRPPTRSQFRQTAPHHTICDDSQRWTGAQEGPQLPTRALWGLWLQSHRQVAPMRLLQDMAQQTQHTTYDSSHRYWELALRPLQSLPFLPDGLPRRPTSPSRLMAPHGDTPRRTQRATPVPSTRHTRLDTDTQETRSPTDTGQGEQQRHLATTPLDHRHSIRSDPDMAWIYHPCLEPRPATLGPLTHRQPTQWQLWNTQTIQPADFGQDFHKSMAHPHNTQPDWVCTTSKNGSLPPSTRTSPPCQPRCQQQLYTHRDSPTDSFHLTMAANSVYNMDPQQREQFLDALAQWHEAQAEQALTGENPIQQYLKSQAYTDHLKQFWDAITPTLYHHFLCRSPHCKIVVLNSHWLRTMEHGSHKQGAYLCPNCLETYRPFSGISYNKNIGQLVQAKQCLVVKVPKDHPANAPLVGGQQLTSDDQEYTYHCFLMEWPERDTAPFIDQLRLIASNLLEGYAVDKVSYLHGQIHLRIRKTERLSYMKRAAWTQSNIDTINDRNTQSGTNKYKLNLLPQTWDSRVGKKAYYYDYFPYKCDETSTILSPEDTTDLLALIYTQTFLQEYTRDLSQTAKKRRSNWNQHQTGTASQPSCMWRRPRWPYEPYHHFKSHSVPPSHLVCEGDTERVNTPPT